MDRNKDHWKEKCKLKLLMTKKYIFCEIKIEIRGTTPIDTILFAHEYQRYIEE